MNAKQNAPAGPLDLPAAWRGEEFFARDDWHFELSGEDLAEIDKALVHSEYTGRAIEQTTADDFPLPSLAPKLAAIQHHLENGSGACRLGTIPVAKYDVEQLGRIFWAIARHLGTPVSQSAAGERIFNVRDEGHRVGQPQARGPNTRKSLSFHTDRCDVIGFLCVREAKSGGENQLISSVTLYNEILSRRPDLLEVLMQPYYYQRHNVDAGNQLPYCRQPVFSFCEGHFAGSFLRVLIDRAYAMPELPDMTPHEREALDYLEEVAADPTLHVTFRQAPGEMLFLNNWVTFHRRAQFEDHAEPELRRHLLRVWLAVPNSRPLHADFTDNYGSTAAGAIRGGMRAAQE